MIEESLSERLAKLSAKVNDLQARLDLLAKGDRPEHIQNRRVRFGENGNWARHYSTVRMTTTTLLVDRDSGDSSIRAAAAVAFQWAIDLSITFHCPVGGDIFRATRCARDSVGENPRRKYGEEIAGASDG